MIRRLRTARAVKLIVTILTMFFAMVTITSAAPFILQDTQTVEPQKKPVINGVAPQFISMENIVLNRGQKPLFSGKSLGMPLKPVGAQTSKVDSMQDILARNASKKKPMPHFKRLEVEKAKIRSQ
ncbi:MAG: hypothetical protein L3J26_03715 [Candidatus Polarisedimenticolaceae bacterium]|nr:hypothetical protein [Candidatus Polarisedimenticolaceae bacterium]